MYSKKRKGTWPKRLHDPSNERQPRRWFKGWVKTSPILPRRTRQLNWLEKARKIRDHNPIYGITIQREGGVYYDKDLRELVDLGYLEMHRHAYSKGWGGDYNISVTLLRLTPSGEAALKRGRI